jgi:hypothetical protein
MIFILISGILQLFAGTLTVGPSFLSIKEFGTLKKKGWTWVYLVQYCTDLGDLIGKIYLFHQGYSAMLSVLGNIKCVQSYRHNTGIFDPFWFWPGNHHMSL